MDAIASSIDARAAKDGARRVFRPGPSWATMAAMLLSVTLPACGWMVSMSNRVAALEVKTESLATAAQMAEVKQKIDDWIAASDREREHERPRTRGDR
jgi:hypothetical protein